MVCPRTFRKTRKLVIYCFISQESDTEECLSLHMTKPTNDPCTQRRLRSAWSSAQSDQSSQCAQWIDEDPVFLDADSEDSDQIGRLSRLI